MLILEDRLAGIYDSTTSLIFCPQGKKCGILSWQLDLGEYQDQGANNQPGELMTIPTRQPT